VRRASCAGMAGLRQALALTAREEFERVPPIFPLHRLPWELQRRILSYADPRGLLAWACEAARDTFGVSWALGVMYAWDEDRYTALASAAENERVQDALAVDEAELEARFPTCDIYWRAAKESDAAMQFQRPEGPDPSVCECIVDSWRAFASCLLSIPLGHEQEPFDMEGGASLYYPETEKVLETLWNDRFCKVLYPMAADDVFLRSSVLRHRTVRTVPSNCTLLGTIARFQPGVTLTSSVFSRQHAGAKWTQRSLAEAVVAAHTLHAHPPPLAGIAHLTCGVRVLACFVDLCVFR
jgi:hypothetical protein